MWGRQPIRILPWLVPYLALGTLDVAPLGDPFPESCREAPFALQESS